MGTLIPVLQVLAILVLMGLWLTQQLCGGSAALGRIWLAFGAFAFAVVGMSILFRDEWWIAEFLYRDDAPRKNRPETTPMPRPALVAFALAYGCSILGALMMYLAYPWVSVWENLPLLGIGLFVGAAASFGYAIWRSLQ